MGDNFVSMEITEAQVAQALGLIQQLKDLFPGTVTLTTDERHMYAKMGEKSIPFVQKALDYCEHNPVLVPGYVDVAELRKDVGMVTGLNTIFNSLTEFYNNVDDTMLMAGSEAFTASLSFYNTVKDGSRRNVSGAKAIYDDLKTRFPGHRKATTPTTPVP